ncbi:NAD(P)-dependent oxidoreductase [Serratia sp. DD3]|uniref:NAD(P)-dependent oxidoreductase n=1 Tax=Serratia sp. DD3 TaxID=1410619 RepID=UPI0003C502A1|nr:NAD(P)-dependent oxidoreductase [Serratia sp. DD3]KEY57806.1 hypothetical protein SRDD_32860 [Serratia sp. DD3]
MQNALIGFSGFVGSTLLKQAKFDALYRSNNIGDIDNNIFDTVVCAGAPAQKWLANKDPESDRKKIDSLIAHLKTIKCKTFILISTVDVFKSPIGVNESSLVDTTDLHAYGLNRYRLEQFVKHNFEQFLIVRLPGLVGPGLRKNIIFDFLNSNNLHSIDSRGVFQFYPMVNLWFDIQASLKAELKLVHLTSSPLSVAQVAQQGFGISFEQQFDGEAATYDMQSQYASILGGQGNYQYSVRETIQAIRAYAQSEPIAMKSATEEKK